MNDKNIKTVGQIQEFLKAADEIEFKCVTRARKTNDNALIEGKNGSIIRKHLGYGYIAQK